MRPKGCHPVRYACLGNPGYSLYNDQATALPVCLLHLWQVSERLPSNPCDVEFARDVTLWVGGRHNFTSSGLARYMP
jgi:hypothetical protein